MPTIKFQLLFNIVPVQNIRNSDFQPQIEVKYYDEMSKPILPQSNEVAIRSLLKENLSWLDRLVAFETKKITRKDRIGVRMLRFVQEP
mmetsp:Transcript_31492/g.74098  ORF Transcript_31492/g.74098 Transcript_31492/m.74098 type:complete len:88 (+) Transcript_31492:38-301(+)